MTLRFASLGSGSSGNATLVQSDQATLLVDCGFTLRETERRCQRLGLAASEIDALLITHEHQDHCKGAGPLARKYSLPVYMSRGTHLSRDFGQLEKLQLIAEDHQLRVADIDIRPVTVPHDAREPLQFVLTCQGIKLGILTDLGSSSPWVEQAYERCHGLLIEANHDPIMLMNGPYPPSLRSRVGGHWGHLSNQQCAAILQRLDLTNIQHLVVGHISRKNNSLHCAREALAAIDLSHANMRYACQDDGFDWLTLTP